MNYKARLKTVLDNKNIDEMVIVEGELQVAMIFTILSKSNVYIWGEHDLHTVVRLFKGYGINVKKVVSIFSKDVIKKIDDVEIISPDELKNDRTENKFFFVIMQDYMGILNIEGGGH